MPLDLNDTGQQPPEFQPFDLDEIKRKLAARAGEIYPRLFPRGVIDKRGRQLHLANTHGDAPRGEGSCVLELKGEHAGCIRDWSTDEHGDQLHTLKCATGLTGRALFEYAAGLVGATPAKPKANGKGNGHGSTRQSDDEKRARDIAFIRQHCVPAPGTLVETYLASRGLDLPDCPDLLFHPSLTDWDEMIGRPAMVTVVRRSDSGDETGGIWRTYLANDGSAKADMPKAKMGLGPAAGGVAKLMSMTEDGTLGIAEGQETALAAAKIFGIPVWAGLSAGGVRSFIFPPGLKQLSIFADRGADGEQAACDLYHRATDAGVTVFVVLPKSDDDFAKDLSLGYGVGDYQPEQPPIATPHAATGTPEPPAGSLAAVIERFNAQYAVVNEAGIAIIYEQMPDLILNRKTLVRISFADLKKFYQNELIIVARRGGSTTKSS